MTTKMLTQKFTSSFYVLVMVGTVVSPYEQYLKDLFRHCIMKEKLLSITYSYNMKMFFTYNDAFETDSLYEQGQLLVLALRLSPEC